MAKTNHSPPVTITHKPVGHFPPVSPTCEESELTKSRTSSLLACRDQDNLMVKKSNQYPNRPCFHPLTLSLLLELTKIVMPMDHPAIDTVPSLHFIGYRHKSMLALQYSTNSYIYEPSKPSTQSCTPCPPETLAQPCTIAHASISLIQAMKAYVEEGVA
jgi:hypothetical protein